jgi:hypothetical protein
MAVDKRQMGREESVRRRLRGDNNMDRENRDTSRWQ